MKTFKRITAPLNFKPTTKPSLAQEKKVPIISSKTNRKNCYATSDTTYWKDQFMVSNSWKKTTKYVGDHFTINATSSLPAWKSSIMSFAEFDLNSAIVNVLRENNYIRPTNIQIMCIPELLRGLNCMLGGETGGGKTLAYAIPILNSIYNKDRESRSSISPRSLIVTPSWELCTQINKVISSLSSILGINCNLMKSFDNVKNDSDIIVSTPHMIEKALTTGHVQINKLMSLVFDEADMVLDKSFIDVSRNILARIPIQSTKPTNGCPESTQLILCNATCPMMIDKQFGEFVPVDSFEIIKADDMHKLIPSISHKFMRVDFDSKPNILIAMLKKKGLKPNPYTLIFGNTNECVKSLSHLLEENNVEHVPLFKDIPLNVRLENFEKFQNGEVRIIVCTDLASRGLDTVKATHVINYEFPRFVSDYIHRTGRVGRIGSSGTGKVTNFISRSKEVNTVRIIEKAVRLGTSLPNIDGKVSRKKKVDDPARM